MATAPNSYLRASNQPNTNSLLSGNSSLVNDYVVIDPTKVDTSTYQGRQVANRWKQLGNTYDTKEDPYVLKRSDLDYINDPLAGITFGVPQGYQLKQEGYSAEDVADTYRNLYVDPTTGYTLSQFNKDAHHVRDVALPEGYLWGRPTSPAPGQAEYTTYSDTNYAQKSTDKTNPISAYLDIGYKKDPVTGKYVESAYFLPFDIFNPSLDRYGRWYDQFWTTSTPKQEALTKYGVYTTQNGEKGIAFPSWSDYEAAMKESGLAPDQPFDWNRAIVEYKKDNNFFSGGPGGALLSTALKFTPLAPVAYAYDTYNAIQNKNPLGVIGSALGAYGAINPGFNPASSIGSAINDAGKLGLSQTATNALGSGVLNTGLGLIGGQNLGTALRGGLASVAGGYAGSLIGNILGKKLGPLAGNLGGGMTAGGINALLRGQNLGAGLTYGGLGGLSQYAGTLAGSYAPTNWRNTASGIGKSVTQNLLKNALYGRKV